MLHVSWFPSQASFIASEILVHWNGSFQAYWMVRLCQCSSLDPVDNGLDLVLRLHRAHFSGTSTSTSQLKQTRTQRSWAHEAIHALKGGYNENLLRMWLIWKRQRIWRNKAEEQKGCPSENILRSHHKLWISAKFCTLRCLSLNLCNGINQSAESSPLRFSKVPSSAYNFAQTSRRGRVGSSAHPTNFSNNFASLLYEWSCRNTWIWYSNLWDTCIFQIRLKKVIWRAEICCQRLFHVPSPHRYGDIFRLCWRKCGASFSSLLFKQLLENSKLRLPNLQYTSELNKPEVDFCRLKRFFATVRP